MAPSSGNAEGKLNIAIAAHGSATYYLNEKEPRIVCNCIEIDFQWNWISYGAAVLCCSMPFHVLYIVFFIVLYRNSLIALSYHVATYRIVHWLSFALYGTIDSIGWWLMWMGCDVMWCHWYPVGGEVAGYVCSMLELELKRLAIVSSGLSQNVLQRAKETIANSDSLLLFFPLI